MSRMLVAARGAPVLRRQAARRPVRHLIFASQGGFFVPLTLITMVLGQHPDLQREGARGGAGRRAGRAGDDGADRPGSQYLGQLSKEVRRILRDELRELLRQGQRGDRDRRLPHPRRAGVPIGAIHITMRNARRCTTTRTPSTPSASRPSARPRCAPGSYVPHGDGQRDHHRCPGEDIVTMAVKLYLMLLLRRLSYTPPRAGPDPEQRALPAAGVGPAASTSPPRT